MADFEAPQDIPWQLMCVSQDMMDPNFCNKEFPFPWRSSMAVSAYEVPDADLPIPFCNGRLTYLKITVSITGYQPTDAEIESGYTFFGNTPVETVLDDIFSEYFGCYGVLANIALFPNSASTWQIKDFPKIVAMEPKLRELLQSATESGEIMTASKNSLSLDKSFSNTHSTETGISAKVSGPLGGIDSKIAGELAFTHDWGKTEVDSDQTTIDSSQDRSEKQSRTTQIEQLYNFLTAYHLGTNRGVYLMLPRPHVLQPTDRRTFVQGIRSIEGIQEFFLAVVRPTAMEGICVEARLDTGHFPEDVEVITPEPTYKESTIQFRLYKFARNGRPGNAGTTQLFSTFIVPAGWVIDSRIIPSPKGDPGHIGISDARNVPPSMGTAANYNYQAVNDTTVLVQGSITGNNWWGDNAVFDHTYTVYLRSVDPIESEIGSHANIAQMVVTSRNLCCCFYMETGPCLTKGPVPPNPVPPVTDTTFSHIVDQVELKLPSSLLAEPIANESLQPAVKGLLRQLKSAMITSRKGKYSHSEEGFNFLETDYFVQRILPRFPRSILEQKLSSLSGIDPKVVNGLGTDATVADGLRITYAEFRMKTGLTHRSVLSQRQLMINLLKTTP